MTDYFRNREEQENKWLSSFFTHNNQIPDLIQTIQNNLNNHDFHGKVTYSGNLWSETEDFLKRISDEIPSILKSVKDVMETNAHFYHPSVLFEDLNFRSPENFFIPCMDMTYFCQRKKCNVQGKGVIVGVKMKGNPQDQRWIIKLSNFNGEWLNVSARVEQRVVTGYMFEIPWEPEEDENSSHMIQGKKEDDYWVEVQHINL